jgi:hypothetical protein
MDVPGVEGIDDFDEIEEIDDLDLDEELTLDDDSLVIEDEIDDFKKTGRQNKRKG